jgi:hypothetical protein
MREHFPELVRIITNAEVIHELHRQGKEIDYLAVTRILFDVIGYKPSAEVIVVGKTVDSR